MKFTRIILSLALLVALSGVAYVAQQLEPAGTKMCSAGEKFVSGLSDEQKKIAIYQFDSPERTRWFFTPQQRKKQPTRKGLRLQDMNEAQQKAALELVRAGTSASGYTKATTIMSLESILRELENKGALVRDPQWYFFTIFGEPSKTGKWGWRVEGHHLSLNFVVDNGKVAAATPAFFGANPAIVKDGPRMGLRTLPEAEELAMELFNSLQDEQRQAAYQEKEFPEIEEGKPAPNVGAPKGLPAEKMTDAQRAILTKLIKSYAGRMPPDVGQVEMQEVEDAGINKVYFAYAGGNKLGEKHTYRVQGPTFVIEFLNVQNDSAGNPANHIHSAWRNLAGDFGIPRK
jgi:hypothetical protein